MQNATIRAAQTLLACALIAAGCATPSDPSGKAVIDDQPTAFAWTAIGVAEHNSCAIAADGQRYCWGSALIASCAQGPCPISERPTRVVGAAVNLDAMASGGGIHCGVAANGEAYCWGDAGSSGTRSLGDGTTERSELPINVSIPNQVRTLSAGYSHACVVDVRDDVYCWGNGLGGKLGREVPHGSAVPGKVATSVKFRTVSAGNTQTCGVSVDDIGYCWGSGYGSLGVGARDTACGNFPSCLSSTTSEVIDGNIRWSMISAGNGFTCGVSREHQGYCWGAVKNLDDPNPALGTLGNGTFDGSKSPVAVAGNLQFRSITTGTRHACGLTLDGEAYCWGNNAFSELGIGTAGNRYATPQRVVGGLRFVSLSLADHTCGITVNQNLYCWGLAHGGRLGIGQFAPATVSTPTRVQQPSN